MKVTTEGLMNGAIAYVDVAIGMFPTSEFQAFTM